MARRKSRYTNPSPAPDIEDWEARNALDTLTRAKEIEKDAKLMARVRKLAAARLDELVQVKADIDKD